MKIKKGDILICVDNKWVSSSLTVGKKYEALSDESQTSVLVRCDRGSTFGRYDVKYFKIDRKERIEKILKD